MRHESSSAHAEIFTDEDKNFILRSLRNGYINDGITPSHSKYQTLIDFIENRSSKPTKSQTKVDYYQDLLTTHQANGKLERVLTAFGSSSGKLDLHRLIEVHHLNLKTRKTYARIKSVAEWLVSADCDETLKAILKVKQEKKFQDDKVKANKELIEQHKRKTMLEEIAKKEEKARKAASYAKSITKPITKPDWGRSKPSKLEDDGNSWREQI
jgi:hypothetical protein